MPVKPLDPETLTITGCLTGLSSIKGLDVSPDGKFVTFGSIAGGVSQIYVQLIDGGEPAQITHGTESSEYPKWSPRGDLIAFLQDIGGDENYQVYVVDPHGGGPRNVTNARGKLHEDHAWSWDGTRVTYVSNRDGQFDVYYSDVDSGDVHRVTNYKSVHHAPEFSPDGTKISFCSNRTTLPNNWDTFVISVTGEDERKITQHEGESDEMSYYANQRPVWSPDGAHILVASALKGNYDIVSIDVHSYSREWLATSSWDEMSAKWSPDGSRIAYILNDDGNLVIHIKELSTGKDWPVSQSEGVSGYVAMRGKYGDYRWTRDGNNIVYTFNGPTEPGSVWIASADGKERHALYSMMPADFTEEDLVAPSLVHYPTFDGRQISAFLYMPKGAEGKVPALVYPHGGPTGQNMNNFFPMIQYLVNRGFAVLANNFRGSTGYGAEFQWLNRHDWGGGDLKDVVAAADWLKQQGISDDIGIFGGSYGGYMTMSAVTKYPDRWKAGVAIYPMVNLATSYETARSDMKMWQARSVGTPEDNADFYYDRSPINFAENITCPVLILQGERDPRCRLEEVVHMRDKMQAAGKELEFKVYEHEGHGFLKRENRLDSVVRTAEFFEKHMAKVPASL